MFSKYRRDFGNLLLPITCYLLLLSTTPAKAGDVGYFNNDWKIVFVPDKSNVDNCKLIMTVLYHHNEDDDGWLSKECGADIWINDHILGNIDVTDEDKFKNVRWDKKYTRDPSFWNNWKFPKTISEIELRTGNNGTLNYPGKHSNCQVNHYDYAILTLTPRMEDIRDKCEGHIKGTWWRAYRSNEDVDNIIAMDKYSISYETNPGKYEIAGIDIDPTTGRPYITLRLYSGNSSTHTNSYFWCDGVQKKKTRVSYNTEFVQLVRNERYDFPAEESFLKYSKKSAKLFTAQSKCFEGVSDGSILKLSKSSAVSSLTYTGYPYPDNLSVQYNFEDNKVTLKWTSTDVPTYAENAQWCIERKDVTNNRVEHFIAGDLSTHTFTQMVNENTTYEYCVYYNSLSWDNVNRMHKDLATTKVRINTVNDVNLSVKEKPQDDRIDFTVNFKPSISENFYRLVINRDGSLVKTIDDIKAGVSQLTVTDQNDGETNPLNMNISHKYEFILNRKANGGKLASYNVTASAKGSTNISGFAASCGIKTDEVLLRWTSQRQYTDTYIDHFKLQKRKVNTNDDFKDVLGAADIGSTSIENTFSDADVIPGVMYEYRLFIRSKDGNGNDLWADAADKVTGFVLSNGAVSGRIMYASKDGSPSSIAAGGADIIFTPLNVDNSEALAYAMRCLHLKDATARVAIPLSTDKDQLTKGYTYSFWKKDQSTYDTWRHYAYVHYSNGVDSLFESNADSLISCSKDAFTITDSLIFGSSTKPSYIDEVQLWNRSLSRNEIYKSSIRHLSGDEDGLILYLPMDESSNNGFAYDMALNGSQSRGHHGVLTGSITPDNDASPVKFRTTADVNGYYSVKGLPFGGQEKVLYNILPENGAHTFSPTSKGVVFTKSDHAKTEVDFVDKTCFTISGKAYYKLGNFPVAGAKVLVDNNPVSVSYNDGDNTYTEDAVTDYEGKYNITVPSGKHEISLLLEGHNFSNNRQTVSGVGNVKDLDFEDATLMKLWGRVVGGSRMYSLPLPSYGLRKDSVSSANIGQATLYLRPASSYGYTINTTGTDRGMPHGDIHVKDSCFIHAYNALQSRDSVIVIRTDSTTGEFCAMLPPINYTVTGGFTQSVANDSLGASRMPEICPVLRQDGFFTDTCVVKFDPEPICLFFDGTYPDRGLALGMDSVYVDSVGYALCSMVYDPLYPDGLYKPVYRLGHPVFRAGTRQCLAMSINQVFYNAARNAWTNQPLPEGTKVSFSASNINENSDADENVVTLNADGETNYFFTVCEPSRSNADSTVVIQASFDVNNRTYVYPTTPLEVIVVGDNIADGSGFITQAPDQVDFVLHRPPGSNSSATLTKGSSFATVSTFDQSDGSNKGFTHNFNIDGTVSWKVFSFKQYAKIVNSNSYNNVKTSNMNVGNSAYHVYSVSEDISTGSGAKFVGSRGDVFIGQANVNLIGDCYHYDFVRELPAQYTGTPLKLTNEAKGTTCYLVGYNGTTLRSGRESSAAFAYTRCYIDETLIPEVEKLRASYLLDMNTDPQTLTFPDSVKVRYVSSVPATDPNFGKEGFYTRYFAPNATETEKNINEVLSCNSWIEGWKNILARDEADRVNAKILQNITLSSGSAYNNTITNNLGQSKISVTNYSYTWSKADGFSAHMERTWGKPAEYDMEWHKGKLNNISHALKKTLLTVMNYICIPSGDRQFYSTVKAGSADWKSLTESNKAQSARISGSLMAKRAPVSLAGGPNGTADFSWIKTEIEKYAQTTSSSNGVSSSISFNIRDTDPYDYLTVEVDTTESGSLSYRLSGGATTNPWEGAEVTKYYNPGTSISKGTLMVQKPVIKLEESNLVDIPNGHKAVLTLNITNGSEINVPQYYNIGISAGSNPDGLVVEMDGKPLAQGSIPVWLEEGQTITKTLSVYQSRTDVMDYKDITLTAAGQNIQAFELSNSKLRPTAKFSVHFKPSCSDITMSMVDQSGRRINTLNQVTSDTVHFKVTDYDLNYKGFQKIQLQRYDRSLQRWQTFHEWYISTQEAMVNNADSVCGQSTLTYDYNMHSMADDSYLMRAVTVGLYGTEPVSYEAPEQTLIKDCSAPQLLGDPSPLSGTLTANDEISVTFNEDIYKEKIVSANLSVTGNLNNEKLLHNTGLQFVGGDPVIGSARQSISTDSTSIEMWLKREAGKACTVFGHGKNRRRFAFGFYNDDRIWVKIGNDTIVSTEKINTSDWQFLHVGFYKGRLYVGCLWNGSTAAQWVINPETKYRYSTGAVCRLGDDFQGYVSQVSMWNTSRTDLTAISAGKDLPHTSAEAGIQCYWPCSECHGTVASDVISHRSLQLPDENSWYISQVNHSAYFTGTDSIAYTRNEINLDSLVNQTIALWMRPETVSGSQTLVSTPAGALTLEDGIPCFYGIKMMKKAITANKWHHLALRYMAQKTLSLLVDGEPTFTMDVDSIAKRVQNSGLKVKGNNAFYYTIGKGFHGWIDEVSFWSGTFPNDVVRYNMYRRMTGSEPGLKCLANMEDTEAMKAHGNAQQAAMAPSLQPTRVEQNVEFTWTASDRKIVITPTEQPYLLEGCTLTCTLDKIADTHGNDILAPITWNVYVNRSTLSLSDNIISLENDSTSWFTIVNNSGLSDNVTISNVPSWLNLSETSFKLDPLASKTITLTGNQSVPAGYYETTLQVTSQQTGISETIDVDYSSGTDARPTWTVNPADFNSSCNIIALAMGDETYSDDENDMVAAYVLDDNNQPVYLGVAKNTYLSNLDDYRFMMNLYFDDDMSSKKYSGKLTMKKDRSIHYVYWDDSEALIYSGVALYGYDGNDLNLKLDNLQSYKTYGTPTAPCTLRRTKTDIIQQIAYNTGWNWISLYTATSTKQFTDYFPANGKLLSVKAQNSTANYENSKWTGKLPTSTNQYFRNMYMVQANTDFTQTVEGTQISASGNGIRINGQSWTWLPYYPAMKLPIEDALRNLALEGDMVKSQSGFAYYTADGWEGTLTCMEPGKGYMYYRAIDKVTDFSYPDSYIPIYSAAKSSRNATEILSDNIAHTYPMNMNAIITPVMENNPITSGTIYVYDQQGNIHGVADLTASGSIYLTISGDETEKMTLAIYDSGQWYAAQDAIDYVSNTLMGTPGEPKKIVFNTANGIEDVITQHPSSNTQHPIKYNLAGQKIDRELNTGIYIKNNKKILK